MRYKTKFIFFFGCFIIICYSFARYQSNYSLSYKNYGLKDYKTFYLKDQEGKCIDSLTFFNLTFKIDSLIKVDKDTWCFLYSVRCGLDCKAAKQAVITILNGKIHLEFAFYSWTSVNYGDWPDRPVGLEKFQATQYKVRGIKEKKIVLEELNYSDENFKKLNKTIAVHYIKYDKNKKLYYTDKILLKKNISVSYAPYFDKSIASINDTCYVIKVKNETVTYIKGKWFKYDDDEKSFIEF